MKKLLIFSFAIFCLAACQDVDDKYYGKAVNPTDPSELAAKFDWKAAGDSSTKNFVQRFFRQSSGFWYFRSMNDGFNDGGQYWPGAPAMDVVVNAYRRTKDDPARAADAALYLDMFDKWFRGQTKANWDDPTGTTWKNPFMDDMEWNVITMLNLYENHPDKTDANAQEYLSTAKQVWDDWIWTEWSDLAGGGILWSKSEAPSKNACSNGPGSVIACKLSMLLDNQADKDKYLEQAKKIYWWQRSVLYDATSGQVYDNINAQGNISTVSLTYNQGTFLGTAHLLYQITGDVNYLNDAVKIARYTNTKTVDAVTGYSDYGVLRDEGSGDNCTFKCIYMRYFVELANEPALDKSIRQEFSDFIKFNAYVLWTKGVDKTTDELLFSQSWQSPAYERTEMGCQASGAALMEAMNILKPIN